LTPVNAVAADEAHPFHDIALKTGIEAMSPTKQCDLTLTRREAFLAAVAGGIGTAAEITTTAAAPIAPGDAADDHRKSLYCETNHIRTYYALNRSSGLAADAYQADAAGAK
jgi:hypothetical protein